MLSKDLMKLTGLSTGVLLHLASNGALLPTPETDRRGTGRGRIFPESEVVIAAILKHSLLILTLLAGSLM